MRAGERFALDRVAGRWLVTVWGTDDLDQHVELTFPAREVIDAIRRYAPELLKEEER